MVFVFSLEARDRDGFAAVQGQLVKRGRSWASSLLPSPALSPKERQGGISSETI